MDFTPDEKKNAIAQRVEASLGSKLEDLITATWIVYALTRDQPSSEPHQLAIGVINTFQLHAFGWSRGKLIPGRMLFEGKDATLDERITQYCELAHKHEDALRPNLTMMLGFVFLFTRNHQEELMHQWVLGAIKRHDIPENAYTEQNPLRAHLVLPDSDQLQ